MSLRAERLRIDAGRVTLLADIDMTIAPGQLVAIVGPNGAGKSTLLAALAGDLIPAHGSVQLNDTPIYALDLHALANQRAVVGKPPPIAFDFTVTDVVRLGWMHGQQRSAERDNAIADVLAECDLVGLEDRIFSTLSSGEQQRAHYARALLQVWRRGDDMTPKWLLLDEPTSSLDIAHAVSLLESLRRRASGGLGVAVVLHELNLAVRFADTVVLLDGGRSVGLGAPASVLDGPTLSRVYQTPVHVEHNATLDRLVVLT